MASLDVYAYGMTVLSTIHLLDGPYPERDGYQEILRTFVFPGGEAANAAILLARWGLRVKLSGPHLGHETRGQLLDYFREAGIDTSGAAGRPRIRRPPGLGPGGPDEPNRLRDLPAFPVCGTETLVAPRPRRRPSRRPSSSWTRFSGKRPGRWPSSAKKLANRT